MTAPRLLVASVGGDEDATATFVRDQLAALRVAADGVARARVWRRPSPGVILGRFHRADPRALDRDGDASGARRGALSRRMSGGRIIPAGPGIACLTLVVPKVDWLDPAGASLRPEQVLNRASRPLLAMLRGDGIDAFYPGRDLVTAGGRTIAHLSFTVMRDGTAFVEMHVAERASFADLPRLLDLADPAGVAAADREALAGSTSVAEAGGTVRDDGDWASRLAEAAAKTFGCEARVGEAGPVDVAAGGDVTTADDGAARDFLLSPGPVAEGSGSAATVAMLGVVEVAGRLRGDRLAGLEVTGDLIAPFHAIDDIAAECEGEPLRPANVRKALARAMSRPRSFLLGLRELDELILRLG